jgi:hypothetical protein
MARALFERGGVEDVMRHRARMRGCAPARLALGVASLLVCGSRLAARATFRNRWARAARAHKGAAPAALGRPCVTACRNAIAPSPRGSPRPARQCRCGACCRLAGCGSTWFVACATAMGGDGTASAAASRRACLAERGAQSFALVRPRACGPACVCTVRLVRDAHRQQSAAGRRGERARARRRRAGGRPQRLHTHTRPRSTAVVAPLRHRTTAAAAPRAEQHAQPRGSVAGAAVGHRPAAGAQARRRRPPGGKGGPGSPRHHAVLYHHTQHKICSTHKW